MKRAVLLSFVLLAAIARPAHGDGVNLAWSNCAGAATSSAARSFTCDDDSRNFTVVASFVAPSGISQFSALDAEIEIVSDAGQVPDWWLSDGGCRDGVIAVATTLPGLSGCVSPWNAQVLSIYRFDPPSGGREKLRVVVAKSSNYGQLTSGRHYYAFTLNLLTTGSGPGCPGCDTGMCLVFNSVKLDQTDGSEAAITDAALRNFVTWQGGSRICAGGHQAWGQLKSFYR